MSAAPLPDDEPLRLETLKSYRILDTPPARSFDNLVQLAAEHFDVPVSLISLVGADRQWFKATVGVEAKQTLRDMAFCAHAILKPDDVLVVEDATRDPRFADNPLVLADPSIRFYAGAPILAENGQPLGTLCVIDKRVRRMDDAGRRFLANLAASAGSILELHRKTLALSVTANRDPLTGLNNRRAFDTALATVFAETAPNVSVGLVALDLDHFKQVNDSLGHDVGDLLLQEVGRRLQKVVRGKDLLARVGGDEFAIVARGPIDLEGLNTLAQRVLQAFSGDMRHGAHAVPIRGSIGIAVAPLHCDDPRMLSKAADLALYRAKRAGGHAIFIATASQDAPTAAEPTLEQELLLAIADQTLSLHWQPYSGARSGVVKGYEALLRWTRANGQAVSPTTMVAMAEKGGFITALDRLVLRTACAAAAAWPQPLSASVNMSACWFSNDDLVGLVTAVLDETGLAPHRLTIELTEGTLVQHTERARACIANLRAKGVRIALDDFGTGYASLGYLNSFDFDTMKLDRTFVQALGTSSRAEAIADAVLALGRALDLTVCAEGVETQEQLRFLQKSGCDLVQGYLLGRPGAEIAWPRDAKPACAAVPLLD